MPIIRHERDEDTITIPVALVRDKNLSTRDIGMLVYMLSFPDDWKFSLMKLESALPKDGRSSVRSSVRRLEEAGYIHRVHGKNDGGNLKSVVWYISDEPLNDTPHQYRPVDTPPVENRPAENRPAENRPAENRPAENRPAENRPAENRPAENRPVGNPPVENPPVGNPPVENRQKAESMVSRSPSKTGPIEFPGSLDDLDDLDDPEYLASIGISLPVEEGKEKPQNAQQGPREDDQDTASDRPVNASETPSPLAVPRPVQQPGSGLRRLDYGPGMKQEDVPTDPDKRREFFLDLFEKRRV